MRDGQNLPVSQQRTPRLKQSEWVQWIQLVKLVGTGLSVNRAIRRQYLAERSLA